MQLRHPDSGTPSEQQQFDISHKRHIFNRMRMASFVLLAISPYFFYSDFILLKDVSNGLFRYTLICIHILSLSLASLFLIMHRQIKKQDQLFFETFRSTLYINSFAVVCILIGVLTSLNSQRFTGNVDAYIVILIAAAIVLPIRPKHFLILLVSVHTTFLTLLTITSTDNNLITAKQINTSGMAIVAFFVVFYLYTYRRNDFFNRLKLQENEESLKKLFAINPYPLVLSRMEDQSIVMINPKASDFFAELQQMDTAAVTYPGGGAYRQIMDQLQAQGSVKNHICELAVSPMKKRWVMMNYEQIDYRNENCVLAGITDITELKRVEDELTKHASIDPLTGVMNRRKGMELLQQEVAIAESNGHGFILCFVDINNLKDVNDRYGHTEGDELIQSICLVIQHNLDDDDTLFRYGGDEFVIIFKKEMKAVQTKWSAIREQLGEINQFNYKPFQLSASMGLYAFQSGRSISIDTIIEAADKEMYKEKMRYKSKI